MQANAKRFPGGLNASVARVDKILDEMNQKLNALVDAEIGATVDRGARLPFDIDIGHIS